jgi:hypothetical protein
VSAAADGYADGVSRKNRAAFALLRSGPVAKPLSATGAQARGATVMGAFGVGAFAVGALAIGRLAIKRAAIEQLAARSVRLGRVEIDELVVRRLHVIEDGRPAPPPPAA